MKVEQAMKMSIFECVAGSHAYGTNVEGSDVDLRGIFMLPNNQVNGLFKPVEQVSDKKNDVTFYELRRYFELAADCNPNIVELLWTPEDCFRKTTDLFEMLRENRYLFLSKKAYHTFNGYAFAQIKRAKGQNKWVNNPKPEEPPDKLDFCWVVPVQRHWVEEVEDGVTMVGQWPLADGMYPFRPVPLKESGVDLRKMDAAKMEHVENAYRLYLGDESCRGVFRGDCQLVVESIPKEDEWPRFAGLLVYNETAYERAHKDWKSYWEWRRNRNEDRWRAQESGDATYDHKNMMHCMRLLWSGRSIMEGNGPIVRFDGWRRDELMKIRSGVYFYNNLMKTVEIEMEALKALKDKSSLPDKIDRDAVAELYLEMRKIADE